MSESAFLLIIILGAFVALPFLVIAYLRWAQPTRVMVFEHEVGLLYRNGTFASEMQAGVHRISARNEKIQRVDIRNRVHVALRVGASCLDGPVILSCIAVLHITDAHRTVLASSNAEGLARSCIDDTLRRVVRNKRGLLLVSSKDSLASDILVEAMAGLQAIGFALRSIRVTEVFLPDQSSASAPSPVESA